MHEPAPTALRVDRLTKVYADGTHALDALELYLPAGCFFGLLGPNGAGKTTLISAVAGLVRAPAGRIFVFGHDAVTDLRGRPRRRAARRLRPDREGAHEAEPALGRHAAAAADRTRPRPPAAPARARRADRRRRPRAPPRTLALPA